LGGAKEEIAGEPETGVSTLGRVLGGGGDLRGDGGGGGVDSVWDMGIDV